MTFYQLNMGRGFLMPLESRRKWLHWVALYLVLMAVAIAFVLYHVVDQIHYWRNQRGIYAVQAGKLLLNHPEFKTVGDYRKSLESDVVASIRDLDSIVTFGKSRNVCANSLSSFVTPLPAGLCLGNTTFDAESRKCLVEVVMPASLKLEDKVTPQKLVSIWGKSSCLSNSVIELENSERMRMTGGEVMCWRFCVGMGGL